MLSGSQVENFKTRLHELRCPFVEGLDDSALKALLFEQSDARLHLLQWLFAYIDERLLELVEVKHSGCLSSGLLLAATSMCLCSPNDMDLIQGKCSIGEQCEFLETLLDLAASSDSHHHQFMESMRFESSVITNQHQFENDHGLLSALAHQHHITSLAKPVGNLFPPDLQKYIDNQLKTTAKGDKVLVKPDIKSLIQSAKDITEQYAKLLDLQDDIDQTHPVIVDDEQRAKKIEHQLRLLLSELSQLQTSLICVYDSHLRVWCTQSEVEFTQLGSTVHRLHGSLSHVCKVMEKMSELRRIYTSIHQGSANLTNSHIKSVLEEIGSAGMNGLNNVKAVIDVLDQAIVRQRQQKSFSS